MSAGVEKAWGLIRERDPEEVCRVTGSSYDPVTDSYRVMSLGQYFQLNTESREVKGDSPDADELYHRHSMYFDHSVLLAMAVANNAGRTGRLVKPSAIKGGHHFFTRGTHVLPLDRLAEKYGSSGEAGRLAFLGRARELGGKDLDYGDIAVELSPVSCMPVTVILWVGDDEFAPRADLLFDSSAEHVAPIDVLWSAAMLSLEAML